MKTQVHYCDEALLNLHYAGFLHVTMYLQDIGPVSPTPVSTV
jgi:hypothetical protein